MVLLFNAGGYEDFGWGGEVMGRDACMLQTKFGIYCPDVV